MCPAQQLATARGGVPSRHASGGGDQADILPASRPGRAGSAAASSVCDQYYPSHQARRGLCSKSRESFTTVSVTATRVIKFYCANTVRISPKIHTKSYLFCKYPYKTVQKSSKSTGLLCMHFTTCWVRGAEPTRLVHDGSRLYSLQIWLRGSQEFLDLLNLRFIKGKYFDCN